MSDKIVGYVPHRLVEDDEFYKDEVKLNEVFNRYCNMKVPFDGTFWDYMTGSTSNQPNRHLTDEELKLVATTIQWLGTPCGKGFLREANMYKD